MAKQLLVAIGSDDRIPHVMPPVKPVSQSRAKTNLLRIIAMLSRCVRRQGRRQTEDTHTPRKSREEENRLEFQRFLYW